MSILVLGGAGYIGSHAVDQLISKGYAVVVVDNLLTGHRSAVHEQATFYEGDIRDKAFLRSVFEKESMDAGVKKIIPHVYSSIIDQETGDTRTEDVKTLLTMMKNTLNK